MDIKELSYNYIEAYNLVKKCGEHSVFNCSMAIDIVNKDKYFNIVGKNITVVCYSDNIEYCLFKGIVREVSVGSDLHRNMAEITAMSTSVQEDEISYCRIFQAKDNKYSDILAENKLEIKNCKLVLSELAGKKYEKIALQNKETNFVFIKRLAEEAGVRLWVDDTTVPANICLKNELIKGCTEIKLDEILSLKKQRINNNSENIKVEIVVLERYINFGRVVKIEGNSSEYVISSMKAYSSHGIDRFEYSLEEKEYKKICISKEDDNIAINFTAKVKRNDDPDKKGRLQVEFTNKDLKDINKDNPRWIPYSSPYTGKASGIVFIPDKDDVVDVIYYNGECCAIVANRENKLLEECFDPNVKYIGNNNKQRIIWKENSLELLSNENKIYLDNDKIELIVGKNKIIIDKEQIILAVNDTKLKLDNKDVIVNASNSKMNVGKSGISAIGKKMEMKSDGQINISGSKINLT